ncbi:uncharacterized protein [Lolium perenne]|uniref:uncharacterized protein n=1 Tax=Lolium perenne TaxID=4522 RepID=UPI0021F50E21|nr:uncharacterized protein LOC127307306 isoform X1 [Lolium perenne]
MGRYCELVPESVGKRGEIIGPVDYGCVRRLRHRRLVTYLWINGFSDTFRGLLNETNSFMSTIHLSRLVEQGLWGDAIAYISRFLGPPIDPQSDEAKVLHYFLRHHKAFHSMVTGDHDMDVKRLYQTYKQYPKHDDSVSRDALRVRSITTTLLYSEQIRASLDWERVRLKASDIVEDLANKVPELTSLVVLPGGSMFPHDVLPIGFGFRRRRHLKQYSLPRPKTLAKLYLERKKMISSSPEHHPLNRGLTDKTRKWLADIIDESLQAGYPLELKSSGKKDAPVAPDSQTTYSTLATAATGAPLAPDSQTSFVTLAIPATGEVSAGAPVAGVEQTVNLTSSGKSSGISSMANADAPVAPDSHTMFGTLTNPAIGAPVPRVQQTVNLTISGKNSGISSVANAGTSKNLGQESGYTESSYQFSHLRKNTRSEMATEEVYSDAKRQRTTKPFGEVKSD